VETLELFASDQKGVAVTATGPHHEGWATYVYFETVPPTNGAAYVILPEAGLEPGEVAWADQTLARDELLEAFGTTFRC
jgi:hypothetical protein